MKVNSKDVKKGDTFIAIGNGHNYIEEAIKNGATKVIAQCGLYDVETLIVKDTHKYLVDYLYDNYYNYIKNLKLIGVTGTNGKTTTSFLIYQALNKLNIKCAYIGTIGFYINDEIIELKNTTPDIYDVYQMLIKCVDNNILFVVMECSSQGLDMHRLDKLKFEYGIFTNLTRDHLDYHKTFENYALVKSKLFDNCLKSIINVDDEYYKYFIKSNSITYGKNGKYKLDYKDNKFIFDNMEYKTNLIGLFNMYNLSAVICLLKDLNLDTNVISSLTPPPGRMDLINYKDNKIIIDYAHTPDAVFKIIKSFDNVITILGCGGNRDKTKRNMMGTIATDYSKYVIFTNDNPRNENPKEIINDMLQKVDKKNYEIILNRKKAIVKGIQMLKKSDILLILGKGHENYQIIGNKKTYFNDKEVVLNYIKE